jgi:hypothetical protein
VVIIAMGAVPVALLIYGHVFSESFFALLTDEVHVRCTCERMRLNFGVTFGAIKPLLATGGADRNLSI